MRPRLLLTLLLAVGLRAEPDPTPYPTTPSPKGLQVQMVDDAVALGIHHAGLNVNLTALLLPEPKPGQPSATVDGFTFGFNENYARNLDRSIKALSDRGIVVTLILIHYRSADARVNTMALHPGADPAKGTTLAANTVTPEGRACYRAVTEFVAARWSSADRTHGRAWGWVIGNEVNSHHEWHQMGPASVEQVAAQYEDQVRLAWTSLRKHSASARVYLSLEHHWTAKNHPNALQACPGRTLLELFAKQARARGDFDWNLAFHPYPASLRDSRTWLDKVGFDDATPKVTFKNLEVVARKLATPELRFEGKVRRLSLTEQGFDLGNRPNSADEQAAAYAYAWEKIRRLEGSIDAFLYHRQVDHAKEGGLRLGLWSNLPGTISEPAQKRPIWFALQAAGTPEWDKLAAPYLPVCGLKNWDEVMRK